MLLKCNEVILSPFQISAFSCHLRLSEAEAQTIFTTNISICDKLVGVIIVEVCLILHFVSFDCLLKYSGVRIAD